MTAHKISADAVVENAMITDGCRVDGTVKHSILFAGVKVAPGAVVEDAVVMGGAEIKAGAVVKHCILGENVEVGENAVVGEHPEGEGVGDVAHVGPGLKIGANAVVEPTAKVYEDVKEGERQC